MENFKKRLTFLARSSKKSSENSSPILWKMGGGLTQSIKSLTEKVKENPYWGEGRGSSVFPLSVSF